MIASREDCRAAIALHTRRQIALPASSNTMTSFADWKRLPRRKRTGSQLATARYFAGWQRCRCAESPVIWSIKE